MSDNENEKRETLAVEHAPVGNAAAMREALILCSRIIGANGIRGNVFLDDIQEAHKAITDALAAQPRQCDVGTAEEKGERCMAQFDQWRRKGDNRKLITAIMEWAQMPYEEEGGAK